MTEADQTEKGEVQQVTVARDDDGIRLDRWFKRHFPEVTHGRLEQFLRKGQVRVDGGRVKANARLEKGQTVRVPPLPKIEVKPGGQGARLSAADKAFVQGLVIEERPDYYALNKPPGLAVQGGTKTTRHLDGLLVGLAARGEDKPRLVHRLDRDTSGVCVVARSAAAAARLSEAFREKTVRKLYWALCYGTPRPMEGKINFALTKEGPVGRQRVNPRDPDDDAQWALTYYATVALAAPKLSWLALRPVTGRTHQLRAHLAAIGHPIVGDPKYGVEAERRLEFEGADKLHLHARLLQLPDKGGPHRITAPLPEHMARTWKMLGFSEADGSGILPGWEE